MTRKGEFKYVYIGKVYFYSNGNIFCLGNLRWQRPRKKTEVGEWINVYHI